MLDSTKSEKLGPIINSKRPSGVGKQMKNISTKMKIQNIYTDVRYNIESQDILSLSHDNPISYGVLKIMLSNGVVVNIGGPLVGEFVVMFVMDWGVFVETVVFSVIPIVFVTPVSSVPLFTSVTGVTEVTGVTGVTSISISTKLHTSNCPFERNIPGAVNKNKNKYK